MRASVIGHYDRSLMYSGVSRQAHTAMKYGEYAIRLFQTTFQKCANCIPEMVTDWERAEHSLRIVLAPLPAMWFVNYGRYITGDRASDVERLRAGVSKNVDFCQSQSPDTATDFQTNRPLTVRAL